VQVPPALAASSRPQQEFDYDFERKVMAADASTSFDAFLATPEVRTVLCGSGGGRRLGQQRVMQQSSGGMQQPQGVHARLTLNPTPALPVQQTAYYDNTKANRFIRAGFSPGIVNLALAHHATTRGDEIQVCACGCACAVWRRSCCVCSGLRAGPT
jgi:hypothetical protein